MTAKNSKKCEICEKKKSVTLLYGPHNFCKEHFIRFFEKRIKKTIRQFSLVNKKDKIAVGVSGGKDSIAVLRILSEIIPKSNNLFGISINEGIKGYRDVSINEAKKNYKELGIDFVEVSYQQKFNTNITEIVQKIHEKGLPQKNCSFCGVFRRRALNDAALEFGANKLATGHNLDDEVQSICMNFFQNDLSKLARLGPITEKQKHKELIPRIKPLYFTPEKEIPIYNLMKKYPFYMEKCCPFSHTAKRNYFREMLDKMEVNLPGTKFGIMNSFLKMKDTLQNFLHKGELNNCKTCGTVCVKEKCQTCIMMEKLGLKPEYTKTELGKNIFFKAEKIKQTN